MEHIIQPRGAGTAYRFKMRTPVALIGLTDPKTNKPFKKWITRSLGGTSHLQTQRFQRELGLKLVCKIPALRHSRIPSKVRDTP
jgi:hypothetical protein